MQPDDQQLLNAYAADGDENAFAQLVSRHSAWMFSAARRRLRDDHLADDATQAAFVLLANKSLTLAEQDVKSVSAWLFRVLHFGCSRLSRTRTRRTLNEAQAALQQDSRSIAAVHEDRLRLLLEDTIAQLSEPDREAIVLRFYQRAGWGAIGETLAITAEAARKRVHRALASARELMLRDGIELIPDELLSADDMPPPTGWSVGQGIQDKARVNTVAKGTLAMIEQSEAIDFTVMTAEFFVNDVEQNLSFFEKLGFRRRWAETPDAMGRVPRASLAGGAARIWLRQATSTEGTRPTPGVGVFFWINGGAEALLAHRSAIAAQGVQVSPFFDDHTLRNFTVTTPDGYSVGFFTSYK